LDVPGIALGFAHRRLSIIDLSPAGQQPLLSASGRWLVLSCLSAKVTDFRLLLDDAGYRLVSGAANDNPCGAYSVPKAQAGEANVPIHRIHAEAASSRSTQMHGVEIRDAYPGHTEVIEKCVVSRVRIPNGMLRRFDHA
jgi:hypothetical protein